MADGSSVRTKVAQYYINQKLGELESKNPQVKVDDWTFLHTISQFEDYEAAQSADEPLELPPIFPTKPGDNYTDWKSLLKLHRARGRRTRRGGRRRPPPWYRVAIIGAGVAGLRTAMLLQQTGIPYEIFEASDRVGGRLFTYEFPLMPLGNPEGKQDYYDVGAMRFPDNDANKATFDLFRELDLSSEMIPYVLSNDDNIRYYNSEC